MEAPALEEVRFHSTRDGGTLALESVPPRLFSEIMRDVDLAVSVAHIAGVDPEASQSSVEMRAALVAETCGMLGYDNVKIDGTRALIDGEIARYAVHLGSATVHRLPGGSVCVVGVHSEQRGRVFLPFADDDPKTAEVTAKVLMLARDGAIRDPRSDHPRAAARMRPVEETPWGSCTEPHMPKRIKCLATAVGATISKGSSSRLEAGWLPWRTSCETAPSASP